MHIVHIITALSNGGAEAAMYRLIGFNTQNKHSVICLTGDGIYKELLEQQGVAVHILDMKNYVLPVKPLFKMYSILKSLNPDIVQTWMYHANFFGGLVAKFIGIPKIFWGIRMSNPKKGNIGKATQAINWICGKLGNYVPSQIVSCAHRATIEHVQLGYPLKKMTTICNGYDTGVIRFDDQSRINVREQYKLHENTLLLGTIARWHPQKDHRTLFDAISQSKAIKNIDWKLILIGPNMEDSNESLTNLLTEFNILQHCILAGQQKDVPSFQSAIDIHILSSSDEGFPNVIAEAMACGTPCISTDAGDAAFIIGDTGWVSPINNAPALAADIDNALAEFSNRPKWASRIRRCVHRIENKFSIEHMSKQYDTLWESTNDTAN